MFSPILPRLWSILLYYIFIFFAIVFEFFFGFFIFKNGAAHPVLAERTAPRHHVRSVAAAAGEQNDGKDDEPYPVVVKQLAEAVVIHGVPPKCIEGLPFCYQCMRQPSERAVFGRRIFCWFGY